jgi:hypothetical protein
MPIPGRTLVPLMVGVGVIVMLTLMAVSVFWLLGITAIINSQPSLPFPTPSPLPTFVPIPYP